MSVDLSVDFSVRYVGMIYNAQGLQHFQEDEVDLINALDQAQVWTPLPPPLHINLPTP